MTTENGVIGQIVKNQGALPTFNRNDPDYMKKVSEYAASLASGKVPDAAAKATTAPAPTSDTYRPTQFDEGTDVPKADPDVGLPSMTPAATSVAGKKVVKFVDDIGDEQEMEIDLADDKLTDLAKQARMVENMQQEMAALRDEVAGKMAAAQAEMAKAKRYMDLEKAGSREAILDELFKDVGGYEGFRKQIIDEHAQYEKMTEEERREFDVNRIKADSARKMAELEKRLNEKEKSALETQRKAEQAARVAVMRTVYAKYKFDNADNDPGISKINDMVFEEAKSAIQTLESQGVKVTENILNREFKKANALFKNKVVAKPAAKVDATKELINQADAAAAAAQSLLAQQQSAGGPESDAEVMQRWLGKIREGKLYEVNTEAAKSARGQGLYARLANMMSRDRSLFGKK